MSDNLKPCWKCGGNGIYVDRHGRYTGFVEDFVSCELIDCMPNNEKYTVEEWQNHKSQPSREDLEKRIQELEAMVDKLATALRYGSTEYIRLTYEARALLAGKDGEK